MKTSFRHNSTGFVVRISAPTARHVRILLASGRTPDQIASIYGIDPPVIDAIAVEHAVELAAIGGLK